MDEARKKIFHGEMRETSPQRQLNPSGPIKKSVLCALIVTCSLHLQMFNLIRTQNYFAEPTSSLSPLQDGKLLRASSQMAVNKKVKGEDADDNPVVMNYNDRDHPDPIYDESTDETALNPFRDIKLEMISKASSSIYSSHQCVHAKDKSPDLDDTRFVTRTCKFYNLYYSPKDKVFHYYASPSEQKVHEFKNSTENFQVLLASEMTVSLGNLFPEDTKVLENVPPGLIWHPEISLKDKPPERYAVISNPGKLALLLFQPFYSFNLGHFLWDDMLSFFSMMDIFDLQSSGRNERVQKVKGDDDKETVVPLPFYMEYNERKDDIHNSNKEDETDKEEFKFDPYFRCDVRTHEDGGKGALMTAGFERRWRKCAKMYKRMYPYVMNYETHTSGDILRNGNWLKGMDTVKGLNYTAAEGEQEWNRMPSDASLILVPTVVAGSGRLGQISCEGDCGIGRASQLLSFREFLLGNILRPNYERIKEEKKKPKGYITFSLPIGSSRPNMVTFFEDIIPLAKEIVGESLVQVVNMANMTLAEEAELAMDTAVLFVNHGGGSASSIFLPKHAAVILFSHGDCNNDAEKWCEKGKNAHYDSIFYNSVSYIRPRWVEHEERDDTEKIKHLLKMEFTTTMQSWGIW